MQYGRLPLGARKSVSSYISHFPFVNKSIPHVEGNLQGHLFCCVASEHFACFLICLFHNEYINNYRKVVDPSNTIFETWGYCNICIKKMSKYIFGISYNQTCLYDSPYVLNLNSVQSISHVKTLPMPMLIHLVT